MRLALAVLVLAALAPAAKPSGGAAQTITLATTRT